MSEEPTAPSPLDAVDLQSFTDEELQRLSQLIISERERRMSLGPKNRCSFPGPLLVLLGRLAFRPRSVLLAMCWRCRVTGQRCWDR